MMENKTNQEDSTDDMTDSDTPPPEKKRFVSKPPPLVSEELAAQEPLTEDSMPREILKISELQRMTIEELNQYAKAIGVRNIGSLTKSQLVLEIVKIKSDRSGEVLYGEGVLEVLPDGFGFLRSPTYNYLPSAEDIYVSPAQIRRFDLKKGDTISGTIRSPKDKEKYFALLRVDKINNTVPERVKRGSSLKTSQPSIPTNGLSWKRQKTGLPRAS